MKQFSAINQKPCVEREFSAVLVFSALKDKFKDTLKITVINQIYLCLIGKICRMFIFFLHAFPPPSYSELSALTCLVSEGFCFGLSGCWDLLPFCTDFCQDLQLISVTPGRKKKIIHSLAVLLTPSLAWVWGIPLNILLVLLKVRFGMNSKEMSSN